MKQETTPTIDDFNHFERYRVRYDDLDTYRHVNNKSFITYVEDARTRYLAAAAGFVHHGDPSFGVMIVHFSIDYRGQILAGDTVDVFTRCIRIGTSSYTLEHLLTVSERTVARAQSILVTYNGLSEQTIPIPESFAAAIRAFENRADI